MLILLAALMGLIALEASAVTTFDPTLNLNCPSTPNQMPGLTNSCKNLDDSNTDLKSVQAIVDYYDTKSYDTAQSINFRCTYVGSRCVYLNGGNGSPTLTLFEYSTGQCPPPLPVSTSGVMGRRGTFEARDTTLQRSDKSCPTLSSAGDGKVYLTNAAAWKNPAYDGSQTGANEVIRYNCNYVDKRVTGFTTRSSCNYLQSGEFFSGGATTVNDATQEGGPGISGCPTSLCDFSAEFAKRDLLKSRQHKPTRVRDRLVESK